MADYTANDPGTNSVRVLVRLKNVAKRTRKALSVRRYVVSWVVLGCILLQGMLGRSRSGYMSFVIDSTNGLSYDHWKLWETEAISEGRPPPWVCAVSLRVLLQLFSHILVCVCAVQAKKSCSHLLFCPFILLSFKKWYGTYDDSKRRVTGELRRDII